jgi:uncharacterized protein YukE
LPLDQLFADILGITQGLNSLVNASETQGMARSLSSTTTDVQQLVRHLDSEVVRLLDEMGGTSAAVHSLLADGQQLVRRVDGQVVPLSTHVKETLDVTRATVKDAQQVVRTEGQSSLVALWSIFKREGKEARVSRKSRFRSPAGTQDYGAMVAAMSQTVAVLSPKIAGALRTLATQADTR